MLETYSELLQQVTDDYHRANMEASVTAVRLFLSCFYNLLVQSLFNAFNR